MWHTWRVSPKTDPHFVSSINEIVVSTSRNVILVIGGAYLLWQSAATARGNQPRPPVHLSPDPNRPVIPAREPIDPIP